MTINHLWGCCTDFQWWHLWFIGDPPPTLISFPDAIFFRDPLNFFPWESLTQFFAKEWGLPPKNVFLLCVWFTPTHRWIIGNPLSTQSRIKWWKINANWQQTRSDYRPKTFISWGSHHFLHLTSIARLIHVNDLDLTTEILVSPCHTCSVHAINKFGFPNRFVAYTEQVYHGKIKIWVVRLRSNIWTSLAMPVKQTGRPMDE